MTSTSPVPPVSSVSSHHEFGPTVLAPPATNGSATNGSSTNGSATNGSSTVAWATPAAGVAGAVGTDLAIETDGLVKRFGSATVVDRVALRDLDLHQGPGRGGLEGLVDLLRLHLGKRLVLGDPVAHRLEPGGDRAL